MHATIKYIFLYFKILTKTGNVSKIKSHSILHFKSTVPVYEVAEILATINKTTVTQLMSRDMIGGCTIWPTYLLTAFGGRLLATLSVAGVPAHWINTAREIKQVISIIHRKTVPPHYSAKVRTKGKKTIIML